MLQRILALTAAIWHNDHTGQPAKAHSLNLTAGAAGRGTGVRRRLDITLFPVTAALCAPLRRLRGQDRSTNPSLG